MEDLDFDDMYSAIGAPNSLDIAHREMLMEGFIKHRHMNKEQHRQFYEHFSKRNRQAISILKGEPRPEDFPERWAAELQKIMPDPKRKAEIERVYRELIRFTDEKEAEFRE